MQFAQQFREVALARLCRRRREGAAQGGRDAGVHIGHINLDDSTIHVNVRRRHGGGR